jgi:hypothetical protein
MIDAEREPTVTPHSEGLPYRFSFQSKRLHLDPGLRTGACRFISGDEAVFAFG